MPKKDSVSQIKKSKLKPFFLVLMFLVILGLFSALVYFYTENKKLEVLSGGASQEDETRVVVEKVAKLMELPVGQEVSLATVSDATKLRDQKLFERSINGDKVIIYPKIGKAIIYRPSTNKIVEVGAVVIKQDSDGSIAESSESEKTFKIAIYNGTNIPGLAKKAEEKILKNIKNVEVYKAQNAVSADYKDSIVVNLRQVNSEILNNLTSQVNGQVSSLPEGEEVGNDVDILVILGSSFSQ